MDPLAKVLIPLKLFLDIVPSSSANITRPLLAWTAEATQFLDIYYRRRNGGNVIVNVLVSFHSRERFPALSAVFLFGRAFVCFVLVQLVVHYSAVFTEIEQSLTATATSTTAV